MSDKLSLTDQVFVGKTGPYPRIIFDQQVFSIIDQFAIEHRGQEYGGVLVGHQREIKGPQQYEVFVEGFIPIGKEEGVSRFTIDQKAWDKVNSQLERVYPGRVKVGWVHTHPGFGVFLSALDKEEHLRFFTEPWQVAYVLDPDNMDRGLYSHGEDWLQIHGYSLVSTSKNSRPQSPISGRVKHKKRMKTIVVAVFWLALVSLSVLGFQYVNSFNPVQRGKVKIDVNEPLPTQVQMKGGVTLLEEWEAASDDRGSIVLPEYQEYQVESGDSLWEIAKQMLGDGNRYQEIIRLNGLTDSGRIKPGMVLRLPIDDEETP